MTYKHIHFVGIKGVGMTALAIVAKEAGMQVTGSDIAAEFITSDSLKKFGIVPFVGFADEHITGADLVITTGAHGGYDNPEVVAAKAKGIPVLSHGEALGSMASGDMFGKKFQTIAVAGTHGKTTTTALIATMMVQLGLDPSYAIGTGSIPSLTGPGHFGTGRYFIAEADEYATEPTHDTKARFLWLHPPIAVITNIEHDHPDIYPTIADVRDAFLQFTGQITDNGMLIGCGDDPNVASLLRSYKGNKISYGFSPANDYVISHTSASKEHTFFRLEINGVELGSFSVKIFGEHNLQNAVAAIAVGLHAGLPVEKIREALSTFLGSKRRFEYIGELPSGALLFDDYAHHPTEIRKTLRAVKDRYPGKKIVAVFQPHTYSRTKELFSDFTTAFTDATMVIITDIYASLREKKDSSVSSAGLVASMQQIRGDVRHLPTVTDVVEYIRQSHFEEDAVIVTLGAGDIYNVHASLRTTQSDG